MDPKLLKMVNAHVDVVINSEHGCGEVTIKILKKRVVRILVQYGFNIEES